MFAERLDALMKIAEVSNSLLGRAVNINSSHIGRLRSGARPLPKKHEFLMPMCSYFAGHITRDYQLTALQKLTGIGNAALMSRDSTASYLEQWLLMQENDTSAATGRLVSGFSRLSVGGSSFIAEEKAEEAPLKYASCLYGNAGKRKAVEQFFLMILQEDAPQTLLLFSDENFAWLYEDAAFSARWAELFIKVIQKGNRVRIVHSISRDMNELLEAVTKWLPIYMTGAIAPYYYPRLRDGVFQRTMFIAPNTAAIISSSVQQNTEGMLNLFVTDRAAVEALTAEYEQYFALCRPLMRIFTGRNLDDFQKAMNGLSTADGNVSLRCAMPPLFSMPKSLVTEIAEQTGSEMLLPIWTKSVSIFRKNIKKQRLALSVLDKELALLTPDKLLLPMAELFGIKDFVYSREQYLAHFAWLEKLQKKYENLTVRVEAEIVPGMLLYVKSDTGVLMAKTDFPLSAFVISERNMVNAFEDYTK